MQEEAVSMQMKELRKVYKAQPFVPFAIHIADGRKVRVDRPDFMARSPAVRATVVFDKTGGFEIIDLLLIASLQVGNGKTRSRTRKKS